MKLRPPVIALLCLGGATVISRLLPDLGRLPRPVRGTGWLALTGGAGMGLWALTAFSRQGTTYEPFETPSALVAAGPYRYTRNPMYLGLCLLLSGVALLAGRPALLLAPALFVAIMDATQVPREEAQMQALFGPRYRDYRRRVRRWL